VNKLLSIETSTDACSVAISMEGSTHEKFEIIPRLHAERILPMVSALLAEFDLSLGAFDAIAFGRGPGSFTSLRIGIGVVQGLAWGAGLPVVPISSLAAVAQGAIEQVLDSQRQASEQDKEISRICVAIDARMSEVYSAEFEMGLNGLVEPVSVERVCKPSVVHVENSRLVCGAGNGFSRYSELSELGTDLALCLPDCWPKASAVSHLAEAWLEHNKPLPAAQAQPVYIRDKVAEKPANSTTGGTVL